MTDQPLHIGLHRLLEAARNEEWTMHRGLGPEAREGAGTDGAPAIKELVARASAGRRSATDMLRLIHQGQTDVDGCAEPVPAPATSWAQVHRDAHEAMTGLIGALDAVTEEHLAINPEPRRNHPQYVWRDVAIYAARSPMLSYADYHLRNGRDYEAVGVLSRWYEAVRGAALPTKARSDASYDLACGLARAGRMDEAMEYLPDAFTYNDRAAVPVLKAWAREDRDLQSLAERADFRALVGT
jgi:tetratricopeptide (TPR) repeat protein